MSLGCIDLCFFPGRGVHCRFPLDPKTASIERWLVVRGRTITLFSASANVLEKDTDRRIGPAPPGCPPSHLSAFSVEDFPLPASLRSTPWAFSCVAAVAQPRPLGESGFSPLIALGTQAVGDTGALVVCGARSLFGESMQELSADAQYIELGMVPAGCLFVPLPMGHVDEESDAETEEVVDEGWVDGSVNGSVTSVGLEARRRPSGSARSVSSMGGPMALSATRGRVRHALLVWGRQGGIRVFAQLEGKPKFVEQESLRAGPWWFDALRHIDVLKQGHVSENNLSRVSSSMLLSASASASGQNSPTMSRPSSPPGLVMPDEDGLFFEARANPLPRRAGALMCLDVLKTNDMAFVAGFSSGVVRLLRPRHFTTSVDMLDDNECSARWLDGPIADVRFFQLPSDPTDVGAAVHVLVVSGLGFAVVFHDVLTHGLGERHMLPGSDGFDALLCGLAFDANLDGQNEIVLGTYSGHMLVYSFDNGAWTLQIQRQHHSPVQFLGSSALLGEPQNPQLLLATHENVFVYTVEPDLTRDAQLDDAHK